MNWNNSVCAVTGYGLDDWDSAPSRGVKLTTNLHLVLRPRMVELYLHSPICLDGIVLN
jgi:hypothetical protein